MKTNRSCVVLALAAAFCMPAAVEATLIASESFEAPPGASYTLSNQFDDGFFDFFDRYAVPDNTNAARDDFQLGWNGSWGILGQDHDGDPPNAATQSVTISSINISGFTALSLTLSVGALNSEPNFNNYEAVDGDGIKIFATIDAGIPALIGEFAPNAAASDLYLDTDGDGIGDGANLTVDLADFAFNIAGTGNSLDLEIQMTSTSSFEPLAIDWARLNGVPEPATMALLVLGGLMLRRRR